MDTTFTTNVVSTDRVIFVGAADGESDADQAQAHNVVMAIVRPECVTQMMIG